MRLSLDSGAGALFIFRRRISRVFGWTTNMYTSMVTGRPGAAFLTGLSAVWRGNECV